MGFYSLQGLPRFYLGATAAVLAVSVAAVGFAGGFLAARPARYPHRRQPLVGRDIELVRQVNCDPSRRGYARLFGSFRDLPKQLWKNPNFDSLHVVLLVLHVAHSHYYVLREGCL